MLSFREPFVCGPRSSGKFLCTKIPRKWYKLGYEGELSLQVIPWNIQNFDGNEENMSEVGKSLESNFRFKISTIFNYFITM